MSLIDKKILIVEDEEIARDALKLIMKKHYKDVIAVRNGAEGFEAIESFNPDLIITDLAMPVMDGFLFIEKLRESHPELSILIVTAYREEADDFHDYKVVYKPVGRGELLEAVKDCLA